MASLRLALDRLDGVVSVERLQGVASPGEDVPLSFGREQAEHRVAQESGRAWSFQVNRIRGDGR